MEQPVEVPPMEESAGGAARAIAVRDRVVLTLCRLGGTNRAPIYQDHAKSRRRIAMEMRRR